MKPRILKKYGHWICTDKFALGSAHTPTEAYWVWREEHRKMRERGSAWDDVLTVGEIRKSLGIQDWVWPNP